MHHADDVGKILMAVQADLKALRTDLANTVGGGDVGMFPRCLSPLSSLCDLFFSFCSCLYVSIFFLESFHGSASGPHNVRHK